MSRITTSREEIRKNIIEIGKEYFDLTTVDLSKTHYLSYVLDVLSGLTANLLNFSSLSYQETLLPTAKLDDSVRNLAMMIGYNPSKAVNASVDVLFTMSLNKLRTSTGSLSNFRIYIDSYKKKLQQELSNNANLTLSDISAIEGFKVQSTNNIFQLINDSYIIESNNNNLRVYKENDSGLILIPRSINAVTNELNFKMTFSQIEIKQFQYNVPELSKYQFYSISQDIDKMIAGVDVYVNGQLWNLSEQLYNLTPFDKAYTLKIYKDKFTVIFGNGVLGTQPNQNDIVVISAKLCNGSAGNVISGIVENLDRLFVYDITAGLTPNNGAVLKQELAFSITNPYNGFGGKDIEDNETIKNKAIAHLTSLNRLVSSNDFKNITSIVDIPFIDVISYLKRSDLKINEINTYGTLALNDTIIPTNNGHFNIATLPTPNTIIPYTDVFTYDSDTWYCPFFINIDLPTRTGSYYYYTNDTSFEYIVKYSNGLNFPIFLTDLNVTSNYGAGLFNFTLTTNHEATYDTTNVKIRVVITGDNYYYDSGFNALSYTPGVFDGLIEGKYTFSVPHITYPTDATVMNIYIQDNNVNVAQYESSITLKYSLLNFSSSQIILDSTTGNNIILDVPLIQKSWYDSLTLVEKVSFEQEIIQRMINFYDSTEIRMLNTFINFKFSKTYGLIKNIYYNQEQIRVIDKVANRSAMNSGDVVIGNRFIIDGPIPTSDPPEFQNMEGGIALYKGIDPSTSNEIWEVNIPPISTLAYVINTDQKFFFNGRKWTNMKYKLPLEIEVILYTDTGYLSYVDKAKEALLTYFKPIFKLDTSIYRSKINDILMNIDGVKYVKVIKPEIDFNYKYKMEDLSFDTLITYTPEYIWFDESHINVRVELA